MSYILEALKKAQAERQLGSAPTLHGASMQAPSLAAALPWWRRPLVLAALLMAVVIVALLVLLLRPVPSATPAVLAASAQQATPATDSAARTGQEAPAKVVASPAPLPAPLPLPDANAGIAPRSADAASTVPASPGANQAAANRVTSSATAPASTGNASKPAAIARVNEEPVLNLRELPEPIQRAIPSISVGGYIYSPNPADRLLLIDKVLRHEGEEVAPGLVLEKLQPREAVFSFRGYRYRVPY
ncbi:general secretion pathway protein GspB [Duganella qianjiadongensis]|uniref:GspB domain-containing protein n=1 Tax=Duganella qianjiadongensis TaxID=2692176 RepID=A0ABW9VN57_9BURK|nr:general secretion pathway protein GspB [Duganella qianjiadongensis]MYM40045.1 GspB domain-containing protein [Duganella qianjiadongensis]